MEPKNTIQEAGAQISPNRFVYVHVKLKVRSGSYIPLVGGAYMCHAAKESCVHDEFLSTRETRIG